MIASLALAVITAAAPVTVSHRLVRVPGGEMTLTRYAPAGRAPGQPAVLLVPDLGFSRAVYGLSGEGLAPWLAQRGFLVYVAELRGQGPSSPALELTDVVTEELPAVVKAVQADTPGPVDLVVHGWTGTLALAATVKELDGQVRRVVAMNTPVAAEVPNALADLVLTDGGRLSTLDPWTFDELFALGSTFPIRTEDTLRASGLRDLSLPVTVQLRDWWRRGDLKLPDGSTVVSRLKAYRAPTLQLLALADGWSPPEQCSLLRDVSKAKVEVRVFSRFEDGDDFSHASILLGAKAPGAVFRRVGEFLRAPEVAP